MIEKEKFKADLVLFAQHDQMMIFIWKVYELNKVFHVNIQRFYEYTLYILKICVIGTVQT